MTQQELFDASGNATEAAAVARDCGIQRAAETCGQSWTEYALGFVHWYLQHNATMHVDELWAAGMVEPKHGSARGLGQVMTEAAKRGWMAKIVTAEGYQAAKPSVRSNLQLKPVWRSLIHG